MTEIEPVSKMMWLKKKDMAKMTLLVMATFYSYNTHFMWNLTMLAVV
jgi:hypothetical protein